MGKTLFIAITGISLILAGCIEQTAIQNQDLNQSTTNQNQNVDQPSADINQNTNKPSVDLNQNTDLNLRKPECKIKECPRGYTQYYIPDCGNSPDGPVLCPPEITQQADCECHKNCWRNGDRDCPIEMPKCKSVVISDTIQYLCF